jgi:hypothetical protein
MARQKAGENIIIFGKHHGDMKVVPDFTRFINNMDMGPAGDDAVFTGYKTSNKPERRSKSWNSFSERGV